MARTTHEVPGYRISRPLGGGSGRVFSATSDATGAAVVVSLLDLPAGADGASVRRRLAALRASAHPHLPRVLDVVDLPGARAAFVTGTVPGASLASVRTARGSLTLPEVAGVLTDVGSALAHLAAAGVVHGDVSPANVVVDTAGKVVLVDLVGDVAIEEGTPGHVPPERLAGGPATAAGDVYALGMLVRGLAPGDAEVEALTGRACDDDPARRPTARALAARAAELGARAGVRLPASASMAGALLREGALREATVRAPSARGRDGRRGRGRRRAGRTSASGERQGTGSRRAVVNGRISGNRGSTGSGRTSGNRGSTGSGRTSGNRGNTGIRRAAGVAVAVAVLGAVGVGWTTLRPAGDVPVEEARVEEAHVEEARAEDAPVDDASAEDAPVPAPDEAVTADAFTVVTDVLGLRESAILDGDTAALEAMTVPGSPARLADAPLADALASTTVDDLSTSVTSVVVREGSPQEGRFVAEVGLEQSQWRAVTAGEETLYPAATACSVLVLEQTGPGWSIADAAACEEGG